MKVLQACVTFILARQNSLSDILIWFYFLSFGPPKGKNMENGFMNTAI
jgi:hypothetical protein